MQLAMYHVLTRQPANLGLTTTQGTVLSTYFELPPRRPPAPVRAPHKFNGILLKIVVVARELVYNTTRARDGSEAHSLQ
eukprot:scaffold282140_cov39-Tisochrysis_lutea.AAC.1